MSKSRLPVFFGLGLALLLVLFSLLPARDAGPFPLNRFGDLPTLASGRLKPLSTEVRHALLSFSGKQTWRDADNKRRSAMEFGIELILNPDAAAQHRVFRIDNRELKSLLTDGKEDRHLFSFSDIQPHIAALQRQHASIPQERAQQSIYDRALDQLLRSLDGYVRLSRSAAPSGFGIPVRTEYERFLNVAPAGFAALDAHQRGGGDPQALGPFMPFAERYRQLDEAAALKLVPPADPSLGLEGWVTVGRSLLTTGGDNRIDPAVLAWADMADGWRTANAEQFMNGLVAMEARAASLDLPVKRLKAESYFHHVAPFSTSSVLYVLVFLLALGAWVTDRERFAPAAYAVLVLAFIVHTGGLVARGWIEARPPVTNLYSSAVFVGWGAVLLAVILERYQRTAFASAMAAIMGFCTLLIAHHLSLTGDTMEVMRAVLNSNFWLATHVVVVTFGYSATFAAGFLALLHIVMGVFTRAIDAKTASWLHNATYGITCFAILFTFVGTILGGIWADQSWGRFWGWDPKENGALMIVLWTAMMLHARWGGLVRKRGFAVMAVMGNIITAWSWFGTNLLGIGLHAYGFTDKGAITLAGFVLSQVLVMLMAITPARSWRSPAAPR